MVTQWPQDCLVVNRMSEAMTEVPEHVGASPVGPFKRPRLYIASYVGTETCLLQFYLHFRKYYPGFSSNHSQISLHGFFASAPPSPGADLADGTV